jgi:hypothetical protein
MVLYTGPVIVGKDTIRLRTVMRVSDQQLLSYFYLLSVQFPSNRVNLYILCWNHEANFLYFVFFPFIQVNVDALTYIEGKLAKVVLRGCICFDFQTTTLTSLVHLPYPHPHRTQVYFLAERVHFSSWWYLFILFSHYFYVQNFRGDGICSVYHVFLYHVC